MGNRVYVGNVPYTATEDDFKKHFGEYTVKMVKIITDRETQRPRGFAFVELADNAEVQAAIQNLDGSDMGGRTIVVNEAQEKPRDGGSGGNRREQRRGGGR